MEESIVALPNKDLFDAFQNIFLFDENKGVKSILIKDKYGKSRQLFLKNDSITKATLANKNFDYYITLNDFWNWKRSTATIRNLNAFYVDIDTRNKNMDNDTAMFFIKQILSDYGIPEPTLVFSSSPNGLYLIWKIEVVEIFSKLDVNSKIIDLWRHIQDKLIFYFDDVGSDKKVKSPGNLIRLPGSYNATKEYQTELIHYNENAVYDLEFFKFELADKVNRKRVINPKTHKISRDKTKKNKPINLFNVFTLYRSRVYDIEKLIELRDYEVEGYRNFILFLYRNFLDGCNDENAEMKVLELNSQLRHPLNAKELKYLNKQKVQYHYRNETLIEALDITEEEQKELKTIISKRQKRIRRRASNRERSVQNYKPIKEKNIRSKKERDNKILKNIGDGKTHKEIAQLLNISTKTIQRVLKSQKNQ